MKEIRYKNIDRLINPSQIAFIGGDDAEVAINKDSVRVYSTFYAALILSSVIMLIVFAFAYTYMEKPLLSKKRLQVFL